MSNDIERSQAILREVIKADLSFAVHAGATTPSELMKVVAQSVLSVAGVKPNVSIEQMAEPGRFLVSVRFPRWAR